MNILILGGGLQGLSTAYSLYKNGYTVSVVTDDLTLLKSTFVKIKFNNSPDDLEFLSKILLSKDYSVIIPMGDKVAMFLSKYKKYLEDTFLVKCAVPDLKILDLVVDKSEFMVFCETNKISHPETIKIFSNNIHYLKDSFIFPALIKPDYSVGARGIKKVENFEELSSSLYIIENIYGSCTLQEYIDNKEYYFNVMLYRTKKGDFPNYTIIKIKRFYPLGGGSSCFCETVENADLLAICKETLNLLDWNGFADFDVLYDLSRKEYKIIEINPRVPASLRAADISGVNFPEIIISDLLDMQIPKYIYEPGKKLRYLGLDLLWFLKSLIKCKINISWFVFFRKDMFYQDIYLKDISTWYTWFLVGLKKIIHRN